jgi:hypothetical protein
MINGNGAPKKKMATKEAAAMPTSARFLSALEPTTGLENDGEDGRFKAEEQGDDGAELAPTRIDVAQRQDRDRAGQDEKCARGNAPAGTVHQPADVNGELLRLRARQQRTVGERV